MIKEIGGYFELEINSQYGNIPENVIALNTARNALRYIIKAYNIKEIYVPYYTCPVVWEILEKENCKINFYHIDDNFIPTKDFQRDDFILYTNYFGICAKQAKELSEKYKNLIVDNAQAYFMQKLGLASFNSVRKFFGVPDGSFLFCNRTLNENIEQDNSHQRCLHLLKRIDVNASFGYEDFRNNSNHFKSEPIKYMSNLTKHLINSIDVNKAKEKRLKNFKYLHKYLSKENELKFELDVDDVPMVYPYLIKNEKLRSKLIKNKIYVAQYWSELPEEYYENYLYKYLLPLPIDHRYNIDDIKKFVEVINEQS
ncbi:MAG: hypothetical protein MJ230_00850 [bacterium]|nr:hypothetical protein [bacterium]